MGINLAPHPPNSPNLSPIESIWDYEKDMLDEYEDLGMTPLPGESKVNTLQHVVGREFVERADQAVINQCRGFRGRLEQCIAHNGNNNWRG